MSRVDLICLCGAPHSYTRRSLRQAKRLGRDIACPDCRRGRALLPPLPERPAQSLVAIAAANSVGILPRAFEVAEFLNLHKHQVQRDIIRLETEGLVARGQVIKWCLEVTPSGWELIGVQQRRAAA